VSIDHEVQATQNGTDESVPATPAEAAPKSVLAALTTLLHAVDAQLLHPDESDFVGRDFVRAEITKFLAVHNRMLVLVGPPGAGKTALAAQLVRERLTGDAPYLAHFCGLSGDDNPFRFCSALAQQLYDRLGTGFTLPEAFRQLVRERFVVQLPADARARFGALVAASEIDSAHAGDERIEAFIRQAVAASQGNFLFVRRYVDACRSALISGDARPAIDPAALLRFEAGTLDATLESTYAATLADLRRTLDAESNDADDDILAALAIAFGPLNMPLLACITGRAPEAMQQSLDLRLNPVIEQSGGEPIGLAYAFYHRGFAAHVRRQLIQGGRGWDVRAAQALEQAADDALLRQYSARHRWSHLLRGLDLAAAARDAAGRHSTRGAPDEVTPHVPAADLSRLDSIAQVQAQVRAPIAQAQLLRGLATQALDPSQANVAGSWTAALNSLKAAEHALRHSRALFYTRQRGWCADTGGPLSPELIELERTLIALGDAYGTIGRCMDAGGQRPGRPNGLAELINAMWDAMVRLPITLYLLMVLLRQG
jgi:hypothetical protein